MTEIKICGIRRQEDIVLMNECRPEMIGFVFYPPSRRFIGFDEASVLRESLDDGIVPVGVFVDTNIGTIAEAVDRGIISAVQLHGNENNGYIDALRRKTDVPIIQAFVVKDRSDIISANNSSADYVLLDNGKGTGNTFDWSLIGEIDRPYILSGGLTPENVEDAVDKLRPFAVDVSSGVETDGYKDSDKVLKFVKAVKTLSPYRPSD